MLASVSLWSAIADDAHIIQYFPSNLQAPHPSFLVASIDSLSPCAWSHPWIVLFSVVALFRTYTHHRNGSSFLSSYHRFTIMRGVCYCTAFFTHSNVFPSRFSSPILRTSLSFYATTPTQPRSPRFARVLPLDVVLNPACFNSNIMTFFSYV